MDRLDSIASALGGLFSSDDADSSWGRSDAGARSRGSTHWNGNGPVRKPGEEARGSYQGHERGLQSDGVPGGGLGNIRRGYSGIESAGPDYQSRRGGGSGGVNHPRGMQAEPDPNLARRGLTRDPIPRVSEGTERGVRQGNGEVLLGVKAGSAAQGDRFERRPPGAGIPQSPSSGPDLTEVGYRGEKMIRTDVSDGLGRGDKLIRPPEPVESSPRWDKDKAVTGARRGRTFKTLLEVEGALRNQHTARRFVIEAGDCNDVAVLLHHIGQGRGLLRLREICGWSHFSLDAGKSASQMSFQRVVVPLLRLVTRQRVVDTGLIQYVLPIFQTIHGSESFDNKVAECLNKLRESRSIMDPNGDPEENCGGWVPSSWIEIAEPVASYLVQVLDRIPESVHEYTIQRLCVALKGFIDEWLKLEPQYMGKREVADLVKTLNRSKRKIEAAIEEDTSQKNSSAKKVAEKKDKKGEKIDKKKDVRDKGLERESSSPVGQCAPSFPEAGHDNEKPCIGDISILPTRMEILSTSEVYLPQLSGMHHLTGVKRLVDSHFRLTRDHALRPVRSSLAAFRSLGNKAAFSRSCKDAVYAFQNVVFVRFGLQGAYSSVGVSYVLELDDPPFLAGASRQDRRQFWHNSRRLDAGALVCLCSTHAREAPDEGDEVRLLAFGRVVTRDQGKDGSINQERIRVEVALEASGPEMRTELLPALCEGNFSGDGQGSEALLLLELPDLLAMYDPVLKALQGLESTVRAAEERVGDAGPVLSLLAQTALGSKVKAKAPRYMDDATVYDLTALVDPALDPPCPTDALASLRAVRLQDTASQNRAWEIVNKYSVLDPNQLSGIMTALRKEACLIHGPPGSGKSFLAIKLVQTLVRRASAAAVAAAAAAVASSEAADGVAGARPAPEVKQQVLLPLQQAGEPPVVFACTSDAALDAFLDVLLTDPALDRGAGGRVVRVGGGGGRHQALNLRELARNRLREQKKLLQEYRKQLDELAEEVERLAARLGRTRLEWADVGEYMRTNLPRLYASLQAGGSAGAGAVTVAGVGPTGAEGSAKALEEAYYDWVDGGCRHRGCGVHGLCWDEVREAVGEMLKGCREGVDQRALKHRLEVHVGDGFQLSKRGRNWNFKRLSDLFECMPDVLVMRKAGDNRLAFHPDTLAGGALATTAGGRLSASTGSRALGTMVALRDVGDRIRAGDTVRLLTRPEGAEASDGVVAAAMALESGEDPEPDAAWDDEPVPVRLEGGEAECEVMRSWLAPIHTTDRPLEAVLSASNIWSLSWAERGRLLDHVRDRLREGLREVLEARLREYEAKQREQRVYTDELAAAVLREAAVVAVGLAGAGELLQHLGRLKARVVVVDEADRALEAQVLALLSTDCEHLVLIGETPDPQALVPPPAEPLSGAAAAAAASAAAAGLTAPTSGAAAAAAAAAAAEARARHEGEAPLLLPRLMMARGFPQMALVGPCRSPSWLSQLQLDEGSGGAPSTAAAITDSGIRGLEHRVFFLDHQRSPGAAAADWEAGMAAALAAYLTSQGYDGRDVAVLTAGSAVELRQLHEALASHAPPALEERDRRTLADMVELVGWTAAAEGHGPSGWHDGDWEAESGTGGDGDLRTPQSPYCTPLSPFAGGQAARRTTEMLARGRRAADRVRLSTLDSFQSQSAPIVIFTCSGAAAPEQGGTAAGSGGSDTGLTGRWLRFLLSRPTQGLYIIGSDASLRPPAAAPEWAALASRLRARGLAGPRLPLSLPDGPRGGASAGSPQELLTYANWSRPRPDADAARGGGGGGGGGSGRETPDRGWEDGLDDDDPPAATLSAPPVAAPGGSSAGDRGMTYEDGSQTSGGGSEDSEGEDDVNEYPPRAGADSPSWGGPRGAPPPARQGQTPSATAGATSGGGGGGSFGAGRDRFQGAAVGGRVDVGQRLAAAAQADSDGGAAAEAARGQQAAAGVGRGAAPPRGRGGHRRGGGRGHREGDGGRDAWGDESGGGGGDDSEEAPEWVEDGDVRWDEGDVTGAGLDSDAGEGGQAHDSDAAGACSDGGGGGGGSGGGEEEEEDEEGNGGEGGGGGLTEAEEEELRRLETRRARLLARRAGWASNEQEARRARQFDVVLESENVSVVIAFNCVSAMENACEEHLQRMKSIIDAAKSRLVHLAKAGHGQDATLHQVLLELKTRVEGEMHLARDQIHTCTRQLTSP